MTVAEATSPAAVFTASTVSTTASFTPPANALLVAICNLGASTGTATGTVTDSLSGVWTLRVRQNGSGAGSAEIWVRDVGATPSAMTVTLTGSTGNSTQLSVRVVTGAGAVAQQQVGATAVKTTSPPDIPITAVAAGSLIYTSMVYTSAASVLTVDASTTAILSTQDSTNGQTNGSAKMTALTSAAGAVTTGWTNAVAAEAVAVEIIAPLASTPPSLRATSAGNTGTNATATSFTIAQPTGLAVGDVCLLWVHMAAITHTATATGFSAVTATSGATQSTQLLTRTITGAESWPLTVTLSAGVPASGVIYAAQGASGFDPTPTTSGQTNTASTTITVAGVTTTQADDLLVWFGGAEGTSGNAPPTITKPAAMTARSTQSSSAATTAVNSGSMCADLVQVTAGASGNQNGTASASRANGGLLVALSPVTGGPPIDTGATALSATAGMTPGGVLVNQLAGVTLAASSTLTATASNKFATLIETFTGTSINSTVWSFSGTNVSIVSNQLQITSSLTATEYQFFSQGFFDLTNSQLMLQLANIGNEAINSWENYVILQDSGGSNRLYWYVLQGFIAAYKVIAGTQTQVYSTGYNATTYQWLRIREASGTTYWEYSADGINWNIAHSEADPIAETALRLLIQAGCYNIETSTTAALYDNINAPPTLVTMAATAGLSITAGALFGPNFGGSASDLGDGTGAWANPTNAIGVSDLFYAVWTAP